MSTILQQVFDLFPTHQDKLDDWQRQFCTEQIARFDKWNGDVRLSEKQIAALEKALAAMKKAGGEQ